MGLARYFVVRQNDHWLVTLEGRAMARHRSQAQAIASAIVMADLMGAMHHDADVMVEDGPGARLRVVWTFGQDKLPGASVRALKTAPSSSHVKRVRPAPPEAQAS